LLAKLKVVDLQLLKQSGDSVGVGIAVLEIEASAEAG
jgi:hypothetical protein